MAIEFEHGSFKGVPYKINYAEEVYWDLVDPRDALSIAFAAFTCPNDGAPNFLNFSDSFPEEFCQDLRNVCEPRMKKIIKNLKKELGPEDWEYNLGHQTPEEFVSDYIYENSQSTYISEIKNLLDLAEVSYHEDTFVGTTQGDVSMGLYFKRDGAKITKKLEKRWSDFRDPINNFMFNLVYTAEIPGCGSTDLAAKAFYDCALPGIDRPSEVTSFIRAGINELLNENSAGFVIEAPYALKSKKGSGYSFSPTRKIKLYARSPEVAEATVKFYSDEGFNIKATPVKNRERE